MHHFITGRQLSYMYAGVQCDAFQETSLHKMTFVTVLRGGRGTASLFL